MLLYFIKFSETGQGRDNLGTRTLVPFLFLLTVRSDKTSVEMGEK